MDKERNSKHQERGDNVVEMQVPHYHSMLKYINLNVYMVNVNERDYFTLVFAFIPM